MGIIRKLHESVGEIRQMYIYPEYRGNGFGRSLLNKLIEEETALGIYTFYLSTYKFMEAAQGLYRSAGFMKRDPYPESESYRSAWKYLIFMEKKL